MTTKWNIPADMWAGQTVAILGAAPGMTKEVASTVRDHSTIVANRAVKFAPWADLFVALDPRPEYWGAADKAGFSGLRVCGVEGDIDAMYAGMFYESVQTSRGKIEIRNNALAALRIAERGGASNIILLGFDAERYDKVHERTGFFGFSEGLQKVIAELSAKGIAVEVRPIEPAQRRRKK